jgi:hypothetical protein
VHAGSPHAGQLFIQGRTNGRPFDDVHGAGWRLVTIDDAPLTLDTDLATWFDSVGGRVVPLHQPDGDHTRWFAAHDTTWALARPDFHLYGTATSAAAASALLAELRHQVTTTASQGATR